MDSKYLGVSEAAARMNISEEEVRVLCRQGLVVGAFQAYEKGPWQIPSEFVEKWIKLRQHNQGDIQKPLSFLEWKGLADSGLREWLAVRFAPSNPISTPTELSALCSKDEYLVSWWRAENNAFDSVSGNDGDLRGAAFGPGKIDQGFIFDGSKNSVVSIRNPANLKLTKSIGITAWVEVTSFTLVSAKIFRIVS